MVGDKDKVSLLVLKIKSNENLFFIYIFLIFDFLIYSIDHKMDAFLLRLLVITTDKKIKIFQPRILVFY